MEVSMELRHLRYFVAVADAGSLTVAAEQKLHTSQPSLSRQIRDLEEEVGTQLISRSAHGVELTSAGKAFLDHARMSLVQAEAAKEAALRAAQPQKPVFTLGFMSGAEIDLLPEVNRVLRSEFPNVDIRLSSDYSPVLARALLRRKARRRLHTTRGANGRFALHARPHGSVCSGLSERSSSRVAFDCIAAPDRERNLLPSVQIGPGSPSRGA
jgi:DNA-binding transcriptional LysR family regulator